MFRTPTREVAAAIALIWPLLAAAADPQTAEPPTPTSPAPPAPPLPSTPSPAAPKPQQIEITATRARLDAARNGLSPDTGSSLYRFDTADLARLPLGENSPLNQVVLQTPGVVQDSYGQLHVRGDHANVQYRIDGVVIPESISGFGQALQTRLAERIDILTGALPAQYGYRTAGVVDIRTKGQSVEGGGSLGLTLGSYGHRELNADIGGTQGAFSYYLTGTLLRNQLGIENPTPARSALHDQTDQGRGFGSLSYLLGDSSRLSLLFGVSNNRFQIPDVPGQAPSYTLAGTPAPDSATLNARQRERNAFEVLSYQSQLGAVDYQLALFHRVTDVHYQPDVAGDLVFNGIAADILRRNTADGLQADMSLPIGQQHTLRAGLFAQRERYTTDNGALVFPADAAGNQTSSTPFTIQDDASQRGHLWGVYLQDEWKPTKALTLNYGLRYDQVKTVVDESQLSPRLGLVFDLTADLRLHAGYARYFTPPPTEKIDTTSVQKFLGTTNALPSDANTAVLSERSNYYDAGVSWQATPKLTLGLDGYYRQVRHLQDEGQFGNALIYSAFNYAQGRVQGLEASASWHDGGLNAYANVAYSVAMGRGIETGQFNFDDTELAYIQNHWVHLDHDQRLTGSAGLSYRWPSSLALSADALFGSGLRRGFANTSQLPGYAQFNVSATRKFELGSGLGAFEGRVSVLNVLDRVYELRDGTGIGVGAPQFATRRAFYVTATKLF